MKPFTKQFTEAAYKVEEKAQKVIEKAMADRDEFYLFDAPFPEEGCDQEVEDAFEEEARDSDSDDWGGHICVPFRIRKTGHYDNGKPILEIDMYDLEGFTSEPEVAFLNEVSSYMVCIVADAIDYIQTKKK